MPPEYNRHRLTLLAVAFSFALSACSSGGGDDGGSDDPPSNTAPVFDSGDVGSAPENGTATGYIAAATDAEADTVSYSINGGSDAAKFSIDSASGVLSFLIPPDFEAPGDANGDNAYELELTASDGSLSTSKPVTISVTNLNDNAPIFTSPSSTSVPENTLPTGYVASAGDADGDVASFSISGGADAAQFSIDPDTGALSFVSAPDFEAPADSNIDNTYEVALTASDGQLATVQMVQIQVTDVAENTAPVFTSANFASTPENTAATGYTATATDAQNDPLSFSISGGADASLFTIDPTSGELSFVSAPDYELPTDADGNNQYDVVLSVSDGQLGASLPVSVQVTDVADNTAPVFTSANAVSTPENTTATGYTATATDAQSDPLSFSISGGEDAALFSIDPASGVLSFTSAPDFEAPADADGNNSYEVTLQVSDGVLSASLPMSVQVTDVADNTAPSFTSATSADVSENATATGYTATATDAEGNPLSFSISGGADGALFSIDPNSGVLSFVATADFEIPGDANTDNVYQLQLTVSDGALSDTLDLSLNLQNLNDNPPVFTSAATASSPENSTDTGYVASATDADGDVAVFSLTGGADVALFSLDGGSGVLSFLAAPDFESPADANGDNVYELQITASDTLQTAVLNLLLTVTDLFEVNDPLFTKQWHLVNTGQVAGAVAGEDLNVGQVWDQYRGNGVRIAIVDDGLEIAHEDLAANVVPGASHDYLTSGTDPNYGRHGTSVGGVAAAVGFNNLGVTGVAPAADLVGFNLLQAFTVANQGDAMARDLLVGVSNNSWGPSDGTGFLTDSPQLWKDGVETALATARGGKGAAIFWAGGNGGRSPNDNSNYDGYANYHGVMAIGALTVDGSKASYSEEGANLLVATPSGEFCDEGSPPPTTVTVDRTGAVGYNPSPFYLELADTNYTQCFNGTSSATPVAVGAAAVILQVRPDLSWRDVRAILARSARMNDSIDGDWVVNGAGLPVNHKYGFGALDLSAAVSLAESWTLLPAVMQKESRVQSVVLPIPDPVSSGFGDPVSSTINVSGSAISEVEFVEINFTSTHENSGDLEIVLTSPSGTESLLHKRHVCTSGNNQCGSLFLSGWRFGSARQFGEAAAGDWSLRVRDGNEGKTGFFQSWTLVLYGH